MEELHPGLHVQRLWPGTDSRELLQAKQTHFYVFRWLCLVWHFWDAMPWRWLISSQPTLPTVWSAFCICICGYRTVRMLQQRKGCRSRMSLFYLFLFPAQARGQASVMQQDISFPQLKDANERESVAINLEWLISIIFLRYLCRFASASLSRWLLRLSSSCCSSWVTGMAEPRSLCLQIEQCHSDAH